MTKPFLTEKEFNEAEKQLQEEGIIHWGRSHPIHRIFNEKDNIVEAIRVYSILMAKKKNFKINYKK